MVTVAAAPASSGTREFSGRAFAHAAGEPADAHEDERRDAERLQQRDVEEEAEAEAERGAGEAAAEQADAHDRERREVGGAARDGELGDERHLDDADHEPEGDEARDEGLLHDSAPGMRVRIWTLSSWRRSANGRTRTSCVSEPGSSTAVTVPIGSPSGNSDG